MPASSFAQQGIMKSAVLYGDIKVNDACRVTREYLDWHKSVSKTPSAIEEGKLVFVTAIDLNKGIVDFVSKPEGAILSGVPLLIAYHMKAEHWNRTVHRIQNTLDQLDIEVAGLVIKKPTFYIGANIVKAALSSSFNPIKNANNGGGSSSNAQMGNWDTRLDPKPQSDADDQQISSNHLTYLISYSNI